MSHKLPYLLIALLFISSCGVDGKHGKGDDIDGPNPEFKLDKTFISFTSDGGDDEITSTLEIIAIEVAEAIKEGEEWDALYVGSWEAEERGVPLIKITDNKRPIEFIGTWFDVKIQDAPNSNKLSVHIDKNTSGQPRRLEVIVQNADSFPHVTVEQDS